MDRESKNIIYVPNCVHTDRRKQSSTEKTDNRTVFVFVGMCSDIPSERMDALKKLVGKNAFMSESMDTAGHAFFGIYVVSNDRIEVIGTVLPESEQMAREIQDEVFGPRLIRISSYIVNENGELFFCVIPLATSFPATVVKRTALEKLTDRAVVECDAALLDGLIFILLHATEREDNPKAKELLDRIRKAKLLLSTQVHIDQNIVNNNGEVNHE